MPIRTFAAAALVLLLVGAGVTYYYAGQEPGPLVKIEKPVAIGGGPVTLDITVDALGSTLRRLEVSVDQQGRLFRLFSLDAPGPARFIQETPDRIRVTQENPASALTGLRDGPATLIVTASRDVLFGVRRTETVETRDLAVRLSPPKLAVVSRHHYVNLGGAEMVVYRVTPDDATSGVQVGNRYYPGYPAAGAAAAPAQGAPTADPALRVAFFALLHDDDLATPIRLVATDPAGNSASAEFAYRAFAASFARRRLPVDDAFFARVLPPILEAAPALTLPVGTPEERLGAFLKINGDVRRANEAQVEDLARGTSAERLWRGAFTRMGRAKSEAVFADHRTYVYDGRVIDQQVHLGTDLASTRGAAITASNYGHVVYAGFLGIYGNCVVLDHGMGVQSLYGHLSSITVEAGDRINRGETIGRSGATGLAGGDHLHFTVLVAGHPVNPVEWWDPHWVADRVDRKLVEAGIMSAAEATKAPAAKPPAKKRAPAAKKPPVKKPPARKTPPLSQTVRPKR